MLSRFRLLFRAHRLAFSCEKVKHVKRASYRIVILMERERGKRTGASSPTELDGDVQTMRPVQVVAQKRDRQEALLSKLGANSLMLSCTGQDIFSPDQMIQHNCPSFEAASPDDHLHRSPSLALCARNASDCGTEKRKVSFSPT